MDEDYAFAQHQTPSIADAFHRGSLSANSNRLSRYPSSQTPSWSPSSPFRSSIVPPSPSGVEKQMDCASWETMEQQLCEEVDLTANGHYKKIRSKLRHLQERVNETDRTVTRLQRMAEEIADTWEHQELQLQSSQTPKPMTCVTWRRGQGTRVQRI
jgi:hypothetical protein